jgi:hypothetical protein
MKVYCVLSNILTELVDPYISFPSLKMLWKSQTIVAQWSSMGGTDVEAPRRVPKV